MALILNVETATTSCSVSLAADGKIVSLKELDADYTHAENLTIFIEHVLNEAGVKLSALDAVAVSKGPGSYTGLRIGVSTAKGLCYSMNKPLIAINTLHSMASGIIEQTGVTDQNILFCPMIDARRMEVFCAVYDIHKNEIRPTAAEIIEPNSFEELLTSHPIYFFGDGSAKCKEVFAMNPNARFIEKISCSAKYMVPLSEAAFNKKQFEDVAYFEPFYLKDFVAGKKKGE
ncbi:MAG: tsaB [Bacteroidota bacterium]|nr:tsaB [Bacteroidota bacterium]